MSVSVTIDVVGATAHAVTGTGIVGLGHLHGATAGEATCWAHAIGVVVPDADPIVVVCTGCGNPLPTTAHAAQLLTSPPCPVCLAPNPLGFEVIGTLRVGHEDEAPASGVYLIEDE